MNENELILKRNFSALIDFSTKINSNLDVDFTLSNVIYTLFAKLFVTKGCVLLFNPKENLELKIQKGINIKNNYEIHLDDTDISNKLALIVKENNLKKCFKIEHSGNNLGYLLLGNKLDKTDFDEDDTEFVHSILNIAATSIQNSLMFESITTINNQLDSKINQLNSLFDLAKEFSGLFDIKLASKKFIYTILGQFLISKYAIITCGEQLEIIESKYDEKIIKEICEKHRDVFINSSLTNYKTYNFRNKGIEIIVPLKLKDSILGLVLLGKRINGKPFTESDIEYISSVASLATISMENGRLFNEFLEKKKIEKDLDLARTIQQNLIPNKLPKMNNFETSAINKPAKKVSGDYFDSIKIDENRTLVVIADVSGKGMQAALLMANLQAFIKSLSRMPQFSIVESTKTLNDLVSENTINGSFITMFWGVINDEDKSFEYVNAGHNPPLLIRRNNLTKLKKGGMILGVMETFIPYESEKIKFESGDYLVLFTDGITEAMDENHVEFTDERLEIKSKSFNNETAEEAKIQILDEVATHTKGVEQSDDITLMIIKSK